VPDGALADLVVVDHFLFVVFVAVGSVLAWKWPRLLWLHVPVAAWALAIVTVRFSCPLTVLEKHFRERAGESRYDGGFIDHYIDGVLYPGRFIALARLVVALLIVGGYAGLLIKRRSAERSPNGRALVNLDAEAAPDGEMRQDRRDGRDRPVRQAPPSSRPATRR
jgi:hypothetical protein